MRKRSPEAHPNGNYYARIKGKRINLGRNLQRARVRLRELEVELAKGALAVGGTGTTQMRVGGKKDVHIKELAVRHLEWVKANRAHKTFVTRQQYICLFLEFIRTGWFLRSPTPIWTPSIPIAGEIMAVTLVAARTPCAN